MNEHRILLVGLGALGSLIFDQLVRILGRCVFLVGGRDLEYLKQRTNLSVFVATQLGYSPRVSCTALDLWDSGQTAEIIARFQPDIIVCAATLQRTEALYNLPEPLAQRLATAQLGPRLPLHLALVYKLMQAIHMTGQKITVLNAIYPDVVGPVLRRVGANPTTGIGDLANNIPGIRHALSWQLKIPIEHIDVRLIMPRYVSYWLSRGQTDDAPFHFAILLDGKEIQPPLDLETIRHLLLTRFKRPGGPGSLLMTAGSAAVLFNGMIHDTGVITHAPGPNGLPGGYPVEVNAQGVNVVLPQHMTLESAIQLNEVGLRFDGIEKIEHDGTVCFTPTNMAIFKEILGYECLRMPLTEVEDRAKELLSRYQAIQSKYR